jgi:pyroglutamyl-peptidase
MKALVTGFEPFGGESLNPALEAIRRLRPALGDLTIETRALPTVFGRSLEALARAIETTAPDLVLAVGLAGGRPALSLERVAVNIDDAAIADNEGQQPVDQPVVAGGPSAYFASLPIKAAVRALRNAGLPAIVSNSAGTFVCNHLFYGLMHLAAQSGNRWRGGFLHIPYLPQQAARHAGAPSMAIEHVVQGIEIILATSAARADDLASAEGALP